MRKFSFVALSLLVAMATFGALSSISACSDAQWGQFSAIGEPGEIVCYSGGKEIFRGKSTGKIATESGSDGWFINGDGRPDVLTANVRVSGDCVIRN